MGRWAKDDDRGGDPQPGWFTLRLVRGGPSVTATIACTDGLWQATVNGKPCQAHTDPAQADQVYRVWHGGVRVPQEEYRYLEAVRAWAMRAMPSHPMLHPFQPVDVNLLAPLVP